MSLDKKKRLVIPVNARKRAGITDSVDLIATKGAIVLTPPRGKAASPISRNCRKIRGEKTIGILGGMGPEASAQLYLNIIKTCQRRGIPFDEGRFPRLLILNISPPNMIRKIKRESELLGALNSGAAALENGGADALTIPCNTASCLIPKIATDLPFINILEETADKALEMGLNKVGLLATPVTVKKGDYQRLLKERGIETVVPGKREQLNVTNSILSRLDGVDDTSVERVARKLVMRGAESLILGCTELPLILRQEDCEVPLLDTLQILAEAVVRES